MPLVAAERRWAKATCTSGSPPERVSPPLIIRSAGASGQDRLGQAAAPGVRLQQRRDGARRHSGMDARALEGLLYRQSGLLGVSGEPPNGRR